MGIGNGRQKAATYRDKMRYVPLYIEPGLFERLRDCADAIRGADGRRTSRQDLIRIILDERLAELENRLGRGETIILRRTLGELVPGE